MYLPAGYAPTVTVGQRVFGGETVVADMEGMPDAAVAGAQP
jgi:hypothetical protein